MSNEKLRNNEGIVEKATEGAEDEATRRKRRRKARRNKVKENIMLYAMLFLMVIGAISILYVPYLYYQNEVLKTNLEYYEWTEANEETSQLIKEFSDYIDSIDVSNGMSWDAYMDFEETVLEYELASKINQLNEAVYIEQSIVSKLEEAYQNDDGQMIKEVLQVAIDSHRTVLAQKEADLAEYEEFVSQYLEMKKQLEEELKNMKTNQ